MDGIQKGYSGHVDVISATEEPMTLCSFAAGVCYGKEEKYSAKRVANCIRAGHTSIIEHASATFYITGISRSCLAQLTRHRIASFSVKSQRYCRLDDGQQWCVVPEMPDDFVDLYMAQQKMLADQYAFMVESGIKKEDARFVLPESTKTDLVLTMNARELQNFLSLRLDRAAQWEIRGLAADMRDRLAERNSQWRELMGYIVPQNVDKTE